MKLLENKPESNREMIELYLVSEEGAVALTDKQKELLTRWQYADELIRRHEMSRETISKMIMRKFDPLSRVTAYQDIVNAEAVFASSTPLNKKYRIQLRIEFLEMKISELYGMVNMEPKDEDGNTCKPEDEDIMDRISRIKYNQEYLHEAKELEKVLQKYYHDYPDIVPKRSPRKIVYNIQFNSLPASILPADEAMKKAGMILNIKPNDPDGTVS